MRHVFLMWALCNALSCAAGPLVSPDCDAAPWLPACVPETCEECLTDSECEVLCPEE